MNKRVAVALSGGVDSAVVALLLKQQGYDVIGVTGKMTCTEEADEVIQNAKNVADKLQIEHYIYNACESFKTNVLDYFENSYKNGETPNPCIMCNKYIKWGGLFDYAINELNADYIATGHYAKIKNDNGVYKLYPASDEHKDQLYFLFMLEQEKLKKTLFPLSNYTKREVKALAEKYNLPPKSAKESQDICFIKPPMTTKKYLNNILKPQKGDFIEKSTGKKLGEHDGFWQYTIGQRKGIGLAAPEALYVVDINAKENIVYVGYKQDLLAKELSLSNIHWNYNQTKREFKALVKIRYNMKATPVKIAPDEVVITFKQEIFVKQANDDSKKQAIINAANKLFNQSNTPVTIRLPQSGDAQLPKLQAAPSVATASVKSVGKTPDSDVIVKETMPKPTVVVTKKEMLDADSQKESSDEEIEKKAKDYADTDQTKMVMDLFDGKFI